MTADSQPTATESEWLAACAHFSAHHGVEPLVVLLGHVTSDLTDEARGSALATATDYVKRQGEMRSYPPLTIAESPLDRS